MSVIHVKNLSKCFDRNQALKNVSLDINEGEMVALIGASGSGKSTLIRHLAGLELGDKNQGAIEILGQEMQSNGRLGKKVRNIRSEVGVVFQQFNLVTRLSVLTNVLTGLLGRIPVWRGTFGIFTAEEKARALDALRRVGIDSHAFQRSSTLSGGQQQRAAIARTLTQGAKVILADEPIASLDPSSSKRVMDLLRQINQEDNVTVLVSLHQVDYARDYCKRIIAMRHGEVVYDGPAAALTDEFLQQLYGDSEILLHNNNNQVEPVSNTPAGNIGALAPA